ncbi:DMT family transporter [Microbulbifer sp. SAOS-129_SWC]|uniref:DMT family transporter n=1 Tax=Microbulbifer sp. SAOS-129_SWC TaxID=3145235 RepID=UPI0032173976
MNTKPLATLPDNGFFLAFAAAGLFSIKAIFIKLAYRYGVDVETFILLRMLLALPFYLAIVVLLKRGGSWRPVSPRLLLQTAALGFFSYYLASLLDLQGLRYINANFERLILYLYPTFVLLMSWLILRKPMRAGQLLCILGAYAGILLIYWQDNAFGTDTAAPAWVPLTPIAWGALLTAGAALSFAIYVTFSASAIEHLGSRQFTALAMLAASAAIAVHFALQNDWARLAQPTPVYAYALTVAFVCTVVPSLLMSAAIERIGPAATGAVGTSGPVITLIAASLVLGEPFTVYHLAGMAVIIGSLMLLKKVGSGQGSIKKAVPARESAS